MQWYNLKMTLGWSKSRHLKYKRMKLCCSRHRSWRLRSLETKRQWSMRSTKKIIPKMQHRRPSVTPFSKKLNRKLKLRQMLISRVLLNKLNSLPHQKNRSIQAIWTSLNHQVKPICHNRKETLVLPSWLKTFHKTGFLSVPMTNQLASLSSLTSLGKSNKKN